MALTKVQINQKSDQKRGVKTKGFKLHIDDIALIEQSSKDLDIPQSQLIVERLFQILCKSKFKFILRIYTYDKRYLPIS